MQRRTIVKTMAGVGMVETMRATRVTAAPMQQSDGCHCGRIDVHAHFLPPAYRAALQEAGLAKLDGGMPVPAWSIEAHLAAMQARGIATSMLSISSPGVNFLDPAKAARLARDVNEAGAGLARDHRDALGFFATLPLPDVAAAQTELAYAFDHLDADGICLETNARGLYLGDPGFAPVFDELERRKAVVFLHPTSPDCLAQIGMGFPAPLLEFPFDTARAVVSLVFSGVFKRRPNIRLILSHGGGALPILLSRVAMVAQTPLVSPRPEGGAPEVLEQVRRMYFDLALSATPGTLAALLQITDLSHILFGTDFPFAPPPAIDANTRGYGALMDTLSADQRRMVDYGNAAELFPRLKAFLQTAAP